MDTKRMIASNDGGVTVTLDGGKNWTRQDSQPTAQFYHVTADTATPLRIYGAQQDSGTVAIVSRSDDGSIDRTDWYDVGGGRQRATSRPIRAIRILFTPPIIRATSRATTGTSGR